MIHFEPYEFACSCGKCGLGFKDMKEDYLIMLEEAREYSECPYVLTSAMRCILHNKNEGGSNNSEHLTGEAVDISTPNSRIRFRVLYGLIMAGFTRIGIGPDFIHAGIRPAKNQEVVWLYGT